MEETSELKQRKTTPDTEDPATASPAEPMIRRRQSLPHRMKSEWDSLLWLFAAFAVFYFTNFASTLVFNELVNGTWLMLSAAVLLVSMGCVAYAIVFLPGLQGDNWREKAPVLITTAALSGIIGGICLAVAVWPVWRFYSIAILFVLFMGFISGVSLIG